MCHSNSMHKQVTLLLYVGAIWTYKSLEVQSTIWIFTLCVEVEPHPLKLRKIIAWIREAWMFISSHLYILNIALFMHGCMEIIVRHVYQKVNYVTDWMASFVANHFDDILWTWIDNAPAPFHNIIFSDFLDCIILEY